MGVGGHGGLRAQRLGWGFEAAISLRITEVIRSETGLERGSEVVLEAVCA